MQQVGADANVDNSELVAIFPEAKSVVKQLIKECEQWLKEYQENESVVRDFLSTKVSMWDIDICAKLALIARYGNEKEETEERLRRLKRMYYLYYPPKRTDGGITEMDIARAKEYPIQQLVEVKNKKARCVWHNDRHPSMQVYPDNHVYCYACSKGGDSIAVFMAINNCDFKTAVRALNGV